MSVAVRSAVSRSAHDCAMIRLRSTHNDHLTSLSSRTTRHPATIEAAAPATALTTWLGWPPMATSNVPPLCNCISTTASGTASTAARRAASSSGFARAKAVGWRQAIRILDSGCALTRAWAAHESSPSRRDSSSSRLPAGRYFATHAAVVEMTPDPALLVTADGPVL